MTPMARTDHRSIDESGWHKFARYARSANFDARPAVAVIELIVVHCISLPRACYGNGLIERFFINQLDCSLDNKLPDLRDVRVSSHFLIERSGRLTQFVACADRAWHAGVSNYKGRENCNDFSIGIELEGIDDDDFTLAQYAELVRLCAELMDCYEGIDAQAILGHQHIAPTRKSDPGRGFDWSEFYCQLAQQVDIGSRGRTAS